MDIAKNKNPQKSPKKSKRNKLKNFCFIYCNNLPLLEPKQLYKGVCEELESRLDVLILSSAKPTFGEDGTDVTSSEEDRLFPMLHHMTYKNAAPIKLYSTINGYK